jgi:hypothetical protein
LIEILSSKLKSEDFKRKAVMGILGLSKLIADVAPRAIKENEIKNYFGRKIAIDASMSLYQFLIAVRSDGAQLTNADGETTSHLMGTFYRVGFFCSFVLSHDRGFRICFYRPSE